MDAAPIVIDNFYEDPFAVRARALSGSFEKHGWRPPYCEWHEYFPEGECDDAQMLRLAEIVGKSITFEPRFQGFFRILTKDGYEELLRKPVLVHIDDHDWSAIICLSLPEHCRGALPFLRHKGTGRCSLRGNFEWSDEFARDSNDLRRWEVVGEVEMKFNRLILFHPRAFHVVSPGYGSSPEEAKLVQQFQFDEDAAG